MAVPEKPITRKETFLAKAAGQDVSLPENTLTREEAYLRAIAEGGGGGGGGGTTNYNLLENKPQIGGVTLTGDKSASDLSLASTSRLADAENMVCAEFFDVSKAYAKDTYVIYDDGLYKFKSAHAAGAAWDATIVDEVDLLTVIQEATGGSGGGSAELTDDLTASVTVGGITSGTTYEEGTSLEDILRDMLDPIAYPTLTNPSVSLAGSGSKLLETGATLAVTLTATFNRGSINPAYGTSGYRSGAVTGYSLNSGASQQGNTWSETVSATNKTFKCTASYAAGEQPKDSKGNNYSSPLAAGSVESGNVTYDFVDAMWANTAAIGTIAKLSLVAKSAKQRDMQFPAQTVANPEVFDIPASWTVTAVQVKNDLSGQYEDASDQFTVTDTTHNDAAGNSVAYKRYTFNKGFDTGARTVRVKWL